MRQSKMPGSGNQSGGPLGPAVPSPGSQRVGLPQGYGRVSAWAQKDSGGPQFTPTSLFQVPLLERGPGSAEVRRDRCSGQEPAESRDPSRAGRSHSATCRPRTPRSSAQAGRLRGAGARVRPRRPPAGPGQGSQSEAVSAASGGSWRGAGGTAWGGTGQSPPQEAALPVPAPAPAPQAPLEHLGRWTPAPQSQGPCLRPRPCPGPGSARGVVPHSCSAAPTSPRPPCPTGTPPGWPRPRAEDSLEFTGDKVKTGIAPATRPESCSQHPEPGPLPCTPPVLDAPSLDMGVSSTRTVHDQGRGTRAGAGQRYRLKGRAGVPDPAAVPPDRWRLRRAEPDRDVRDTGDACLRTWGCTRWPWASPCLGPPLLWGVLLPGCALSSSPRYPPGTGPAFRASRWGRLVPTHPWVAPPSHRRLRCLAPQGLSWCSPLLSMAIPVDSPPCSDPTF